MEDKNSLCNYIDNSSRLIDKNIHRYLFSLFKYIFLKQNLDNSNFELVKTTDKINKNIIKNKDKYIVLAIETRYSIKNFKNIIYFVNIQNKKYTGEIIEGILIIIFSNAFKVDKNKTFGKYLFNNINKLKDSTQYELANWFENASNKFINEELHNFKLLLSLDSTIEQETEEDNPANNFQEKSPFFNLLKEIYSYKYKYILLLSEKFKNNKALYYMNRGEFNIQKMNHKIYDSLKGLLMTTTYDKDTISNSICHLISCFYFSKTYDHYKLKVPIGLMRAFFISVFIYYQNKNSPLMKYIPPKEGKNEQKNERNEIN